MCMADSTIRALRLLSLLQRRRYWPGSELADRLEISERTLRRDVERLRELGYSVNSERGVSGGYRLGTSNGDAILLLDNDEAIALAAALHSAASGTTELAEATLGALTKVLSMLGPQQRRRVEALLTTTASHSPSEGAAPQLSLLDTVACACRDQVRLSFDYLAADAASSSRYVEPCQLVALDGRWYLVAFDCDRADWRTFRVDRMTNTVAARNSFPPRPAPAADLFEYVRFNMSELITRHRVIMHIDLPANQVRNAYATWAEITDLGPNRCQLRMDTDTFQWPTHIVVNVGAPVTIVSPPEFRTHLQTVTNNINTALNNKQPPRHAKRSTPTT